MKDFQIIRKGGRRNCSPNCSSLLFSQL